ncbi:MAG: VWA domain-containing protein [Dehalococcoidales bacterium]|nr:VWA domain-containing protein [Dehalococcoidales bacterium]
MSTYRYSKWDETQDLSVLNSDDLMDELGHNLMSYGDLSKALRMLQFRGTRDSQGKQLPSIQELLQRLQQRKQSQLNKYDLGSIMDEIRKKLANIIKTERQGIQRRLDTAKQKTGEDTDVLSPELQQKLLKTVKDMAAQNLAKLDAIPPDTGSQIKELINYDFIDEEARRQFQELLDMLKRHAMASYNRDLVEKFKDMDASTLADVRNLVEAINQLLEQKMQGQVPDFKKFMEQFGNYFGAEPPQNLDELIDRLQNQISQAQSLLNSLNPEDRESLYSTLQSVLDRATQFELAKLAANIEALHPSDNLQKQYPFSGDESISHTEALKLMEMMQKIDKLETQLKGSQYNRSLDTIDDKLLKELMGDEAADQLEKLRSITKILEKTGYIRLKNGKYELTPRGMRKIGQKALQDIFAKLRKDRSGGHNISMKGLSAERLDDTKKYEFGDDLQIHLGKTIMNSLYRRPQKPPVKLNTDDFEVFQTEELTRSSTVLVLDLSLSMPMRGNFQAAKQVTLALDELIRNQYPQDSLHIVGFSSYARRIKKGDISSITWDEFDPYTNMQHGLYLARKILAKERCTNKQIILISDGEPTAHFEDGNIYFHYPPSMQTLRLTLREVRNCTQKGIIINTFMLDKDQSLNAFITYITRINKGRVFFTNAESLGRYLMIDYISSKRRGKYLGEIFSPSY